jgi:microcystin-dependent protein
MSRPVILKATNHGIFNPHTVTRKLDIYGNLTVKGLITADAINVENDIEVGGGVYVQGEVEIEQGLTVGGASTLAGVTANSLTATTLNISGASTLSGVTATALNVTGDVSATGTVNCDRLYVRNNYLIPPGTIVSFISSSTPSGWLFCDGTSYLKTAYPELALVLTAFGGNSTNFNVPDLRGRTIVGLGTGATLTPRTLAQSGGSETYTLTLNELPNHTHTGTTNSSGAHTHTHNANGGNDGLGLVQDTNSNTASSTDTSFNEFNLWQNPIGLSINSAGAHTHTFTTDSTGSGNAFNIMQPYLVLNYIIKY